MRLLEKAADLTPLLHAHHGADHMVELGMGPGIGGWCIIPLLCGACLLNGKVKGWCLLNHKFRSMCAESDETTSGLCVVYFTTANTNFLIPQTLIT